MKVWILTTGNRDVQLKTNQNWENFYYEVLEKGNTEISYDRDIFISVEKDRTTNLYPVPSRVLGIVYEEKLNNYTSDLAFPLFDTYFQYFERNNIKLDEVIVLLTDQQHIFQAQQRDKDYCPYWQDTYTLGNILTWYFQNKFQNILRSPFNPDKHFLYLKPKSGRGLDHWNETLSLVENVFRQIQLSNPEVYISHQAGTPAISSAVQFVSLNRFKNVNFILSNQYYDITYNQQTEADEVKFEKLELEIIQKAKPEEVSHKTSEYWRSLQIEKAKQLVISGFPGAALKIIQDAGRVSQGSIDELQNMVNFFNLHNVERDSKGDFEIANASQRIIDSLDLIGFFLNQKNYLQGVTLLAATQETFLKTAILHEVGKLTDTYQGVSVSEFLQWDEKGLFLIIEPELRRKLKLSENHNLDQIKKDILNKLKFPPKLLDKVSYVDRQTHELNFKTNKNSVMLAWLQQLISNVKLWGNLIQSCDDNRDRENDLRNQFMHNLRGMEDIDAIQYLLGSQNQPSVSNVMDAYNHHVKQPFLETINILGIPYERDKLQKKLKKIADSLDE
ncbi:hypothetical protein WA1_36280 [Scytonema hofmannii PCC 7110]|uniref:CRISPR-associated protein n=1 Tax=Scytonema hofmannii PCC 7110 TaxID=128403 RepID=A0A139X1Q4_9CYAN|nr:hypothetical protein [Scytonema hofmannii]KYC38637.1 hypothetical protein WA1_36280 [Scytonema hofmannii PCC 7110]